MGGDDLGNIGKLVGGLFEASMSLYKSLIWLLIIVIVVAGAIGFAIGKWLF